jgi:hypothetical protein
MAQLPQAGWRDWRACQLRASQHWRYSKVCAILPSPEGGSMDANVSARYFRVSDHVEQAPDFSDLLLGEMGKAIPDRERDVTGAGVLLRVEQCEAEGRFVSGQFCRKQTTNIPPQAGPRGLAPIVLPDGQGIGHLAAFRYHKPTRVILLQNNINCTTPHRISLYLMMINAAAVYGFKPVFREDALERFKNRKIRSFTVGFASPENLEALDDNGIAAAQGAKLLAEAYKGLDLTITIRAGKKRKQFLYFQSVYESIKALLGSNANISQLKVSANEDEIGRNIDFLEEHMKCKETLDLPESDHSNNYKVRKDFLQAEFNANIKYLTKHFGAN